MTHDEQRVWLIRQLLDEEPQYRNYRIPGGDQDQKNLFRALMNVRPPKRISEDFLKIQDEYLTEENLKGKITDLDELTPCRVDDRIFLWQGDITTLRVDAIVNAANSGMTGCYQPLHNCIDNIIGSKAGIRLRLCCNDYMCRQAAVYGKRYEEPTGRAVITSGYSLPCRFILHTVGPIVSGGLTEEHERLLASCYTSCLDVAAENGLKSVAFCCISTGVFMFPQKRAAEIATETVRDWLDAHESDMKVVFNVFKDEDKAYYEQRLY
ncbi:MAG: protein-ADP-ribose hydrolase [Firmicutes bacterium]|nr:protein-ADP-ribose hydrolase [Bacillota bacterium]